MRKTCWKLFHRDALRQILRLVYVATSPYGYVVGEQLQRDDFQYRQQELVALGNVDDVLD